MIITYNDEKSHFQTTEHRENNGRWTAADGIDCRVNNKNVCDWVECLWSWDGRDGDWARAADVEEERRFLVWIESTWSDVVQSTGDARQLQVDVTASEHDNTHTWVGGVAYW